MEGLDTIKAKVTSIFLGRDILVFMNTEFLNGSEFMHSGLDLSRLSRYFESKHQQARANPEKLGKEEYLCRGVGRSLARSAMSRYSSMRPVLAYDSEKRRNYEDRLGVLIGNNLHSNLGGQDAEACRKLSVLVLEEGVTSFAELRRYLRAESKKILVSSIDDGDRLIVGKEQHLQQLAAIEHATLKSLNTLNRQERGVVSSSSKLCQKDLNREIVLRDMSISMGETSAFAGSFFGDKAKIAYIEYMTRFFNQDYDRRDPNSLACLNTEALRAQLIPMGCVKAEGELASRVDDLVTAVRRAGQPGVVEQSGNASAHQRAQLDADN